jgi:hypothetical protein
MNLRVAVQQRKEGVPWSSFYEGTGIRYHIPRFGLAEEVNDPEWARVGTGENIK